MRALPLVGLRGLSNHAAEKKEDLRASQRSKVLVLKARLAPPPARPPGETFLMTSSGYPTRDPGNKPRDGRSHDQIGYIVRVLAQATLPHRAPENQWRFARQNGRVSVMLVGQQDPTDPEKPYGLPYGSIPRCLMAWLGSEYKRTGDREIDLGPSQRSFLRALGIDGSGGAKGGVRRVRWQLQRLMTTAIQSTETAHVERTEVLDGGGLLFDELLHEQASRCYYGALPIIDPTGGTVLWWSPKRPDEVVTHGTIVLSREFAEVLGTAIPVDIRALRDLARSPLAQDLYVWLTHRLCRIPAGKRPLVPWTYLEAQFGSDYGRAARQARRELDTRRATLSVSEVQAQVRVLVRAEQNARRDFRKAAKDALYAVFQVYPGAHFEVENEGLRLAPSLPHVPRRPRKDA